MNKTILSANEKECIFHYLDEINGGVFNADVNALIAPNYKNDAKSLATSADLFVYFFDKGVEAVENGLLTFNQLLGKEPL